MNAVTLASRLAGATGPEPAALQRLTRQALVPLALCAVLFAAWAALAPIGGAVVAAGQLRPEFERKTLQHQEGGIVRAVYVREGQAVRAGDALLEVGDLRGEARLAELDAARNAARAQAARAEAELKLAPRFEPDAVGPPAPAESERALFEARRRTLDEQLAAIGRQQTLQARRAAAFDAQVGQATLVARSAEAELGLNRRLADEGFVQPVRLLSFERARADALGRGLAASGEAEGARAQGAALAQQGADARGQYQQRAADELRTARQRIAELDEQIRPLRDLVERQLLRAPSDGVVMGLRVTGVGVAVGPREPLLELAPSAEALRVHARIAPRDIAHVAPGARAQVRIAAFDARGVAPLAATVVGVAPDAASARDGEAPSYLVRLAIDEAALHGLPPLVSGMPAEVFIGTAPRSVASYLLRPLANVARRAAREP